MARAGWRSPWATQQGEGLALDSVALWETVVWAGMAGVLAVLCLIAAGDLIYQRTVPAARGLAFILITGGSSVLMSGLPETLFPEVQAATLLPLKAVGGPISGALALTYLGIWMDATHTDRMMRGIVRFGSYFLVLTAVGLAFLALLATSWTSTSVLALALAVNVVSVAFATLVAIRGAAFGDRLARWMVVACASLLFMVLGLYAKGMGLSLGLVGWTLTALATVGYFLIVIVLTILRNREERRLRRVARGLMASPIDVHMPQGSQLIPRVEEAIWRSDRFGRDCVVAAVTVRNLYELAEEAGHGSEAQILAVLAARIRRHVGFRNVVGLYHPRCFVLAVSAGQDPRRGELMASKLRKSLRDVVLVTNENNRFGFRPKIGMGVVDLHHEKMDALTAINRAEQLALEDQNDQQMKLALDGDETQPPSPL
jgi:GGDEF domain-containing protein